VAGPRRDDWALGDDSDEAVTLKVREVAGGWSVAAPPWLDVLLADPCVYCGSREPITMDHIEPVRDGAKLHCFMKKRPPWHNAAPACQPCNSAKGSLSLLGFVAAGGLTSGRSKIRGKPPSVVTFGFFRAGARVNGLMRDGRLVFVWHPKRWFPPRS
jgi:hypothetical protein